MKNVLFLAPLFILMSCQPTKTVEPEASSGNINISAPYMWPSSAFPRNLKISNAFNGAEVANIQAMSSAWELGLENKKNFFNNTERTGEVSSSTLNLDNLGDDGVLGVYKIEHWYDTGLSNGALAVTQIFGRRYNVGASNEYVRIEHADILVNYTRFDFRTDDSDPDDDYDLRTVLLHEMGHFLGLGHKYGNTVMIPAVSESTENREPTSVDIADMANKYNIAITSGSASAIIAEKPVYKPAPNDPGQMVKIMIELHADGNCIHKENGKELYRHAITK